MGARMTRYRTKDDFQVKTFDLCPACNTLQEGVKPRREYVYGGGGWVETTWCEACHKAKISDTKRDMGYDNV